MIAYNLMNKIINNFQCRIYRILKNRVYNFSTKSNVRPLFSSKTTVLGIETSCDDTGCAIINGAGEILGESLYSQHAIHLRYGGVNPVVAHDLHRDNIEHAVSDALHKANIRMDDVDAIAVTVKPGLIISLRVGVQYARYLSRFYSKPLIPIHHMEAHALVARMYYDIPFPFLVLLISGGHCLIAVAKDVNEFLLLGKSLDNAPGEVMDKAARRMKLRNIPQFSKLSGGHAIESAAELATNVKFFEFPIPLLRYRDCNFSFSGLKDSLVRKLTEKEKEHGVLGDEVIPEVNDLCAAFQLAITEHIVHRTERAILFCQNHSLLSNSKNIVVSGGVACNNFIFKSLQSLGNKLGYTIYRPPPKVCTDNGVMIAWNGIEKLKQGIDIVSNIDLKDIEPKAPFGQDLTQDVKEANLAVRIRRLNKIYLR